MADCDNGDSAGSLKPTGSGTVDGAGATTVAIAGTTATGANSDAATSYATGGSGGNAHDVGASHGEILAG